MTETLEGKLTTLEEYYSEEGESSSFTTYYVEESSVNEFLEKFVGKEVLITVKEVGCTRKRRRKYGIVRARGG